MINCKGLISTYACRCSRVEVTNVGNRYRKALQLCLIEGGISDDVENLLDWRFFYALDGVGRSTCGFAREVGARYLRSVVSADEFLTPHW